MKCNIYYSYIRSMQRYVISVVDKDNGIEYKTLYAKNKSELGSIIEDIKSEFDVVEIKTGSPSQFANKLHIKLQNGLSADQTEFFKHSKIRDSNGLLKCIHSTVHQFSTFDKGSFGSNYRWGRAENMGQFGPGFYFSVYNEEDELSDRGRFPVGHMFYSNSSFRYWQEVLYDKDTKSFNNMVCYLNIVNPFTFDKKTKLNEVFDDKQLAYLNEALNRNMSGESEVYYSIFYRGTVDLQKVTSMLKNIGYDGIWFTATGCEGGQVIAFYPEQIKSVTNLSPTDKTGINEDMSKNELEKRADEHKKKQDGLSPFCSLGERLDRKSIDKNRIDIARLLGIPSGGIIVSENGRVEIHNIPEDDARRYSNILRNKVKDIRFIPGKYDFRKVPLPGQVPGRLVTISGMLKDSLTEEVLNGEKEFAIEYDFYNVNGYKITDHIKGVIYASTTDEAIEKFNGLVKRAREFDQSFVCIGKPIFLNDSLIDIGDKYKVYRDGKMIKDNSLVEAKKKKKKRLGGTLNPDAGNVEHNINMFNHMNSPTGGPSNNPVSGPFSGDVSAPSVGGCCEAFEKSKKELIEGMRLTNGMRELEEYYFDDGNYSYHFFGKQDFNGITNQFAVLVVDYGFEFHYDKMYRDEKTNTDVIPTSMRHERPKKICYFEFDEATQPDIVDAFLDDDMSAFRNAVKAAAEKEIEKNPLNETKLEESTTKTVYRAEYYEPKLGKWISYYENSDVEKVKSNKEAPIIGNPKIRVAEYAVSGVRKPSYKFVNLVENVDHKENYYMAKYRGVNTNRLHKVYFSCEGNFEDAENLLDDLIAEPYTDARVLGTVSPAAAERDGFTKIGGTSNKELDDDFNMSTRTLW